MRLIVSAAILLGWSAMLRSDDGVENPSDISAVIDRGLAFLARDAVAWKAEYKCASCHHAALVVWSMHAAKGRGHTVDESLLAELTKWMAEAGEGKTSLPRPEGRPKALNTKALYFALGLEANPEPDALAQQALQKMLKTVREDQTENGSWSAWPETRPPLFGASDETMTALAVLALTPAAPNDELIRFARDQGIKWLHETMTDHDPQSIALRLILWSRLKRPQAEIEWLVQDIRHRQNADGGWSQSKDMASDAWATGQALYALKHAGIDSNQPVVSRGQSFLIKSQRQDGSWPMTSRPTKPGDAGAKNLVPIIGGGTAWAIIGLASH